MTEQELAELKAELMKELTEELSAKKQSQERAKALQPILDKWCNGEYGHEYYGRHGPLIEALPRYRGWNTWEHMRRITCNIMNVSYVRNINDVEKAQKIADRLCEVVVELVNETVT